MRQFQMALLGVVVCVFTTYAQTTGTGKNCNSKRPALTSGQTYTVNQNCPNGGAYNTATQRCRCWSYCGYICETRSTTTTTQATTTTTATNNCANKKPKTIPAGSKWVSAPGCPNGPTYNEPSNPPYHCHCWGRCGYICDPKTSSSTTDGTVTDSTTADTSTTDTTTTPSTTSTDTTTTDTTTTPSTTSTDTTTTAPTTLA